jgi:GT2 family glycosyltransferase
MISLIIPTNKTNIEYTNNILNNIKEIYPDVEIIVEENYNVTLGINYNNAVAKSTGDKIILLHNDMVIKPGFLETMDKHIQKGRITTYTRVEPPIYNDTYPGKILLDCGSDLESFDREKFLNFNIEEKLEDGGSQLFFGCMKEDYVGIDGYTFKMFCEDDDLHLRYKLAGFEHKVSSAHVYHFVSKTSRVGNYQEIEIESNKNFVKKWGFRKSEHNVVYNKKCIINNSNPELNEALNWWFNGGEDIIVEIDGNTFTQQDYTYIQQLNDIIKETNDIGVFAIGNIKLTINKLEEQQHKYLRL